MNFSSILYHLVIKPISLLPYPLLYGFSDFFFIVFYYLVGYRKKVVTSNLRRSFPEKSEAEIKQIRRKFYRHFCDIVFESLKNFSIKPQDAQARMKQVGAEIFDKYYKQGKSVILCGGHMGNWELWAVASPAHFKHELVAIYKRLSNAFFDDKMRESRGRFGLKMVPTREIGNYLKDNPNNLTVTVFGFDQSPSNPEKCVWVNFLNQETAALFGAEKYAQQYNSPIVFGHLRKIKRGYYEVEYTLVTEEPLKTEFGEITQKLHTILEADIRKNPEIWLWSHKRWKHKRPSNENFQSKVSNE